MTLSQYLGIVFGEIVQFIQIPRQFNPESRSPARLTVHAYGSTVVADDGLHNCKA
jgi:hypothetical protein